MDLFHAIRELYEEKRRLDIAISALENRETPLAAPQGRRGRKSMNPAERKVVSERMRRYWEKRRSSLST